MKQRKGKDVNKSTIRAVLFVTILAFSVASLNVQRRLTELLTEEFDKMPNAMIGILATSKTSTRNASSVSSEDSDIPELTPTEKHTQHGINYSSLILEPETSDLNLELPRQFPRWMRRYFNWHAKHREVLNETNWESEKYLILRCTHEDKKCGGLADRLKPLPYLILVAAREKRLFMIRWNTPARLEEFLLPNKMDWSVPDWMERKFQNNETFTRVRKYNAGKWAKFKRKDKKARVVEGKIQDILGGAEYYEKAVDDPNETYDSVYHDLFSTLFKPSPPIEEMVMAKMQTDHLTPGEYSVAHYRAFYGIEDEKQTRAASTLESLAINAVNCASVFRPGGPVYFASDSKIAVDAVKKYGETKNRSISVLEGDEPLHIDKYGPENPRSPSDFYSVFVDLLLMANGRCVTYGQGGFGRFALLLSQNATCFGRHIYKLKTQKCRWVAADTQ